MSRLWSVPCRDLTSVGTLPALTTVFTPPSICSTYFTDVLGWAGDEIELSGTAVITAWHNQYDPVWYSCIPKEYNTKECLSLTFSPGLCPWDWTTLGITSEGGVTTASCCMRGFELDISSNICQKSTSDFILTRRPNPHGYATKTVTSTNFGPGFMDTTKTLVNTVLDTQTITMSSGDLSLYRSAWVIMWQSSDRISTSATPTPPRATELPKTEDREISLSGGAIAGIVIGVLAAFGLGVMMGLLIRRRRPRPAEGPDTREQPIYVQQDNFGGQNGPEQRPNGSMAPDVAYAVEGGTAVGSGFGQPRPWFAFLGSRGRGGAS